jgi:predicted Fe-Mo cluster-binding NifX family protein
MEEMEIVKFVCATGYGGLKDAVFHNFEDCQSFTVVEIAGQEIKDVKIFPNRAIGIDRKMQTIQFVIHLFPDVIVAGNFEEQSKNMFSKANIKTFINSGVVEEALYRLLSERKESNNLITEHKMSSHEILSTRNENRSVYSTGDKKEGLENLGREESLAILKRKEEYLLRELAKIKQRIKELEPDVQDK